MLNAFDIDPLLDVDIIQDFRISIQDFASFDTGLAPASRLGLFSNDLELLLALKLDSAKVWRFQQLCPLCCSALEMEMDSAVGLLSGFSARILFTLCQLGCVCSTLKVIFLLIIVIIAIYVIIVIIAIFVIIVRWVVIWGTGFTWGQVLSE